MGLGGLGLWCHITAVETGSGVDLFVNNIRSCRQTVILSVEDFGELAIYDGHNVSYHFEVSKFVCKFWFTI